MVEQQQPHRLLRPLSPGVGLALATSLARFVRRSKGKNEMEMGESRSHPDGVQKDEASDVRRVKSEPCFEEQQTTSRV